MIVVEKDRQHVTLDMIAYLFVPQRDDDISSSVTAHIGKT